MHLIKRENWGKPDRGGKEDKNKQTPQHNTTTEALIPMS